MVLGRQYPSDRPPLASGRILPSIAGGQRGDPFPFPSTLRTHPLLHHAAPVLHHAVHLLRHAARLLPHALRADVLQLRQVVVVLLGPLLAARSQRGLAA